MFWTYIFLGCYISHEAPLKSLEMYGNETAVNLIKAESILNCQDKKWCSFLCVLGLSSVIQRQILTYYPDFGLPKFKTAFQHEIEPRSSTISKNICSNLHMLLCYNGQIDHSKPFKHNHFVPLISVSLKRKQASKIPIIVSKKDNKY